MVYLIWAPRSFNLSLLRTVILISGLYWVSQFLSWAVQDLNSCHTMFELTGFFGSAVLSCLDSLVIDRLGLWSLCTIDKVTWSTAKFYGTVLTRMA